MESCKLCHCHHTLLSACVVTPSGLSGPTSRVNSRSQMRDSSPFVGGVTVCSLCVCRAVPTSRTPSCTPWDRTVLASGRFMNIFSLLLICKLTPQVKKQMSGSSFRILEVARCSQLTDVGFTTLARVSVSFILWFLAEMKTLLPFHTKN